jgi:hypothetical protein
MKGREMDMKVVTPLKWPDGWPRTLPEKQEDQKSWKQGMSFYRDALETELKRMDAVAAMLTYNDTGSRDTGVAVWFSRPRDDQDFSWRDTLELKDPYPSSEDIQNQYRIMAKRHHPDAGGDVEIFKLVEQAKRNAIAWVDQMEGKRFGFSIGCDAFRERRLNVAGIVGHIQAIRKMERCGCSALVERTWQGFAVLTEGSHVVAANA